MASEEKKWREFYLQEDKKDIQTYEFIGSESPCYDDDIHVIEIGALKSDEALLRECMDMLERSCAISCPECGASGYNQHAENCRYLILIEKLNARLGGEK